MLSAVARLGERWHNMPMSRIESIAAMADLAGLGDPGFAVYVHWPFCLAKCPYCDFNSHVRASRPTRRASSPLSRARSRIAPN